MIRITKQTDYGIVLLTQLAATPERPYNAPELAAETRLPLPMVSKILKLLARDGLLISHRGVKGGYSLRAAPAEISVAEIIAALEGPIALTECIDDRATAPTRRSARCAATGSGSTPPCAGALEGITLAEMAQPLRPKLVTLGAARSPASD